MPRIAVIVGSRSSTSINRRLAAALHTVAPESWELVDVDISGIPLYSPDIDEAFPAAERSLKSEIERADAVILVTPEHNRGPSAVTKNAVDVASRPWGDNSWNDATVVLLGAGLNPAGTAVAQAQLRATLGFLGAHVVGGENAVIWDHDRVSADGIPDAALERQLRRVVEVLESRLVMV